MTISGRHIREGANIIVDGRKVAGTLSIQRDERVEIGLDSLPSAGMHFLQVQNPGGLFSNDFIFHVVENEESAAALRNDANPDRIRDSLAQAIERGDLKETKRLLGAGAPLNARRIRDGGMTPLSTAVFHGRMEIAKYLVGERKASVSYHNRDGNTPLHLAAFLCRTEMVDYLLEHDASLSKKSDRGETPVEVVSSDWNDGLGRFYQSISDGANLGLDLEEIQRLRPKIAKQLRDHAAAASKQ
jgi:hypothetical protein